VDELCERFSVSEKQLLADLGAFGFTGTYPYTPDVMNEIRIDGDWVEIDVAPQFRRPLRLTQPEAAHVLAALSAVSSAPGVGEESPQRRAFEKLRAALGGSAEVQVDLGDADPAILETLRHAVEDHSTVAISYWVAGRDEQTQRDVDPAVLTPRDGAWYLDAWCHRAAEPRVFRVDRIATARPTGEHFTPRPVPASTDRLRVPHDAPLVTLVVPPSSRATLDRVPLESVRELDDGGAEVTLALVSPQWLARLLLELGPRAQLTHVAGGDRSAEELRAEAAELGRRILRRHSAG
jgi:proteasome accessory factor C